ncbi:MAG: ImmA/IrrE family metallo-endopeptidase [bacterium]|nr:ImmA/IrrE family metallo-endopeptidase [bacterium]
MSGAEYKKAIQAAEKVLKENYVLSPPVLVEDLARNFGFSIEEVSFPKNEDVSGIIKPEQRLIYINKNDPRTRKNFTIAHEIGHWLLHQDILVDGSGKYNVLFRRPLGQLNTDPIESEANCFAANLLVPKEFLNQYSYLIKRNLAPIDVLADLFAVSIDVIGYRLKYEQSK